MKVKPYSTIPDHWIFQSWKYATMLWFCYYMGLRPNSTRLIEIKHINFNDKTVYIPRANSKTRQDDIFPIPDLLMNKLWAYLKIRCKVIHNSQFLFPNIKGKASDKNYFSDKIRRMLKNLQISKLSYFDKAGCKRMSKNLYSLRHSFGTRVYQKTHDIKAVAIMLGHHDTLMRCASVYAHISDIQERPRIMKQIYG